MCGIVGAVWSTASEAIDPSNFDRMTDVMHHRGPDGRGVHRQVHSDGSGVALGHRRLSIIDLAGGAQPMHNEDCSIWITFNGEIYNYVELKADLESRGHQFQTSSDTETIVHLYEEYGDACLEHLRGMFAFGIWDEKRRRLFIARDRLGQKPLVYSCNRERFVFASEIKSILAANNTRRELDPIALQEYLTYYYVPHPRTMFRGISKLPPAHYAILEAGKLEVRRYWMPDLETEAQRSLADIQEEFIATVDEAVRLRLRSDVPLGAFLSGGIDSTAVVGLMQRHASRPTKTFTIGFPESEYDESSFARIASEHLRTEHKRELVQPDSLEILPKLVWHFDEPFADSSAIPTYYVSQMTRQHVKVALTGDGGDELFAGYPRYQTIHRLGLIDRLPDWTRKLMTNRMWDLIPGRDTRSISARLRHRMQILRLPPTQRYVSWVGAFNEVDRRSLLRPEVADQLGQADPLEVLIEAMEHCRRSSWGVRAMHTDLQTYLPCDLLVKVDITGMANGLECRSPFLDHRVVELSTTIPFRYLFQQGMVKPMLSRTFAEFFPESLRSRPKQGFSVPLNHWFRNELRDLVEATLLAADGFAKDFLDQRTIRCLFDQHLAGTHHHGDRLWALLFFEQWGQDVMRSNAAAAFAPTV